MARISFSSAVSSVSPLGVTLPTSRSPEPTSAPTRTTPRSSRLRSESYDLLGVNVHDGTAASCQNDVAGVDGGAVLKPGAD